MTSTKTTTSRPSAAARAAARHQAEDAHTKPEGPAVGWPQWPTLDLPALLKRLRLPELDSAKLIDGRQRDIDTLLAANEQAYRGFEAVMRRQAEMLTEAMKAVVPADRATEAVGQRASELAGQAQHAFGQALANMKELAELSARSHQQVVDTLNQRLRERVGEAGDLLRRQP